jgi:NAD(P)-dependent dehydrogenase (short-subunit alcohol dehydrogenase family)
MTMENGNGRFGKVAVVTGASRGLGRSMARHFAGADMAVVGTYHSSKYEAHALVAEIEGAGGRAAALQLDVSRSDTFGDFATTLRETLEGDFGRFEFDVLINNAGIGITAPFAEMTEEQFDQLIEINLKSPFFLTQKLLPMIADGGRVLNVSSGLTRITTPGYAAYAATKGGIEVLTRYMAKELGERQIRVNVIAPGAIETDFGGGMVRDNRRINDTIAGATALGRVGLPDDVGSAVAAILSDDFAWANGTRIEVSGGQAL